MQMVSQRLHRSYKTLLLFLAGIVQILAAGYSTNALAVPAFARQTGQNCVACHAGGQFPELTPYGRIFKLTGYTIGERTIPLSAMAVFTDTKVRNTSNPNPAGFAKADFPAENGIPVFNTASVFLAGKITDNIGGFAQWTFNNYDHLDGDGNWRNWWASDNADIRYADRYINANHDLIFGLTFNNNPSVQDVWNSAPAWGFDVVPGSNPAGLPSSPNIVGGMAQQVVGLGGYVYWNKTLYAEFSSYRTADKAWSFMSQGFDSHDGTRLRLARNAPYARIALTKEWGAHNLMIGAMALSAELFNDPTVDDRTLTTKYRDVGVDAQYQYILDPHTVTAQFSYIDEHKTNNDPAVAGGQGAYDSNGNIANSGANTGTNAQPSSNASDKLHLLRLKTSYVYRATYGGSLSYFNLHGTFNSANQTGIPGDPTGLNLDGSGTPVLNSIVNNISGKPDTVAWIPEVFWIPVQNVRVGMQYSMFTKYQGARKNYDGFGRNASDNNALFLYVWGAY